MAEKVIQEVRIVETDDGFRIEIKGDKERLRQMGIGKGMFGFGGMGGHGPFGHRGPRGFGFPFGRGGRGPWWTEGDYPSEEKAEKA